MKFDSYQLKARILPAIPTIAVPIMIFNHFYISEEFSQFVGKILGAKVLSNLTISTICLYFLSEAGRLIGKNIFERLYFKEEKAMPTTEFMLYKDDTFSDDFKIKIREKVLTDFGIRWPTKEEEMTNEHLARVRIAETMALIRKKLKGNPFLLQHNIEYGVMRNAIGGSLIGIIFSICNIIFFAYAYQNVLAVKISYATLIIYSIFLLASRIILFFYGKSYAKILFREYI